MTNESIVSKEEMKNMRPLSYLRGLGCLDETGVPRDDLAGVLCAAAVMQFEAGEVAPQELMTLFEAIKQCLAIQSGTAFEQFQEGIDQAMDITADLLNKEINGTLYGWIMEWQPFMESPPCLDAFIGHLVSVVTTYGLVMAMKQREA